MQAKLTLWPIIELNHSNPELAYQAYVRQLLPTWLVPSCQLTFNKSGVIRPNDVSSRERRLAARVPIPALEMFLHLLDGPQVIPGGA